MKIIFSLIYFFFLCNAGIANSQLLWSTYYGGTAIDYGISTVADQNGNLYFTGLTKSNDFPVSAGAFQISNGGDTDVFITKFNNTGQRIWSTYCGGLGAEQGRGIICDKDGNIIITGFTNSTNFPVTNGCFQTTNAGNRDIFIIKFNSTGQKIWSTYYGGVSDDEAYAIATDSNRNIFITGFTNSQNFPVTPNALQLNNAGQYDVFVLKFSESGQRIWATYYGGSLAEGADAISVDINDNILLTGFTYSFNFPVSPGAFQTLISGDCDAFVVKLSNSGNRLWSTYYGGSGYEYGYGGICSDKNGNVIISGWTESENFPVTVDAFQTTCAGNFDAFIVKMNSLGQRLYATYYGGSDDDRSEGISTDNLNNIIVSGFTKSINFPVLNAFQINNAGNFDVFIFKFNSGNLRQWSTYFGGNGLDQCHTVYVANSGNIVFSGKTDGTNFPVTPGAFQMSNSGQYDMFIVYFAPDPIGITKISENIPEKFSLLQNYPNPFNPLTHFGFQVANFGFVSIKIYNVLGSEVMTLVNEEFAPGTYEAEFDGTNYPSGVYYYRLTASDYTETKKMILIK